MKLQVFMVTLVTKWEKNYTTVSVKVLIQNKNIIAKMLFMVLLVQKKTQFFFQLVDQTVLLDAWGDTMVSLSTSLSGSELCKDQNIGAQFVVKFLNLLQQILPIQTIYSTTQREIIKENSL